jgi:spore coat protein CotH
MISILSLVACVGLVDALNPSHPGDDEPGFPTGDTAIEDQSDAPGAGFPFADGQVFELSLTLPPASVDGLVFGGDYVAAELEFAGYEAETGVRLKGASTFDTLDGKPSLKLNFGAFTPGARFLGVERLTMNAMKFDPTKLREAAAYRLFEQVGVPASQHGFAHLTINGEDYGLYSLIETLDENFLGRGYPDDPDGNLYDSTFIFADLTGAGIVNFDLQEGDPATAGADLQALVADLDAGAFEEVFERRFDVSTTLSYLAVDLATSNWDGYSRNTNNYLLYHATLTDRWSFVPWGQDTAFRGGGPVYGGVRARITTACLGDPVCRPALEQRIGEVLAIWEDQDLHGWTQSAAADIGTACAADPRKEEDCDFEDILEALLDRPGEVRAELGL